MQSVTHPSTSKKKNLIHKINLGRTCFDRVGRKSGKKHIFLGHAITILDLQ